MTNANKQASGSKSAEAAKRRKSVNAAVDRLLEENKVNEMTFVQLRKLYSQVREQETSLLEAQKSTSSTLEELKLLKQKLGALIQDIVLSESSFSREIQELERPGASGSLAGASDDLASMLTVRDHYNDPVSGFHKHHKAVQEAELKSQLRLARKGDKVTLKKPGNAA